MKVLFLTLSLVASVKATNTFANAGVAECKASCSNGSVAVGGTGCYCGKEGTFVADDKWCYVNTVNHRGYQLTGVMCSNTDGTVAATAACKCGVNASGTEIAVAQDEFCLLNYAGYGVKLDKKLCANTDGTTANADQCVCGLTGTARDTAGATLTASHKCFSPANSNGLGVTTAANGTSSSADSSPACTSEDGSTAMSGATCKCGIDGAHVADGKVCLVRNTTWTAAGTGAVLDSVLCSSLGTNREKADGSTPVGTACTCGLDPSNGNAGTAISDGNKGTHKCLENATTQGGVSGNTTSTPACGDTDGGTAAGNDCKCGTDFAAVTSGKVCLVKNSFHGANEGKGVQLNTVLCSSLGSNREKADGLQTVGTACTCGLNASNGAAGRLVGRPF